MNFEFFYQEQPTADLEIEDIGNVAIIANNDAGMEYYLILKTDMGLTKSLEYGPSVPDVEDLPMSVTIKYNQFEFSENKIIKMINKFLNSNSITQAREAEASSGAWRNLDLFLHGRRSCYSYCQ